MTLRKQWLPCNATSLPETSLKRERKKEKIYLAAHEANHTSPFYFIKDFLFLLNAKHEM
jgi:hypothetical protein